jgi:hypothetical protein
MAYLNSYPELTPVSVPGVARRSRFMFVSALVGTAALGLAAAAGCTDTEGGVHRPSARLALTTSHPLPLSDRLVPPGAFTSYVTASKPAGQDPSGWVRSGKRSLSAVQQTAQLQRLGYVGGVIEYLHRADRKNVEAIAVAEQFRSPSGAGAEFAYRTRAFVSSAHIGFRKFSVPIPGARAVRISTARRVGFEVVFAEGRYFYLVGASSPARSGYTPTRAQVVSAATSTDLIVNGCVAGANHSVAY